MSNIKIGIIGAGNISKEHLEVLKFIDYVDIVGITSRTLSKAKKLAYNFNKRVFFIKIKYEFMI